MRSSSGQKTQRPGHGKGRVNTATGVTPEIDRVGQVRSFSAKASLGDPTALPTTAIPEGRQDLSLRVETEVPPGMAAKDPIQRALVDALAGDHAVDDRVEFVTRGFAL